jgi:hypothetical protein
MPAAYPYGQSGMFYDPSNLYGGSQDLSSSFVVGGPGGYLANSPQAAYLRFIAPFAGGNDAFGNFVRSQYSRAYGGFQAAAATNPDLGFGRGQNDYLRGLGPDFFRNLYGNASAEQRGINTPRYGAGRVQWQRQFL